MMPCLHCLRPGDMQLAAPLAPHPMGGRRSAAKGDKDNCFAAAWRAGVDRIAQLRLLLTHATLMLEPALEGAPPYPDADSHGEWRPFEVVEAHGRVLARRPIQSV